MAVRSQPDHVDYTGSDPTLARLFTLIDEMFTILFEDVHGTTTTALPVAAFPALTGDVTTPGGSYVTTLAASGVTPGTYGDATHIPQITFDAKGRATAAAPIAIVAGVSIKKIMARVALGI